MKHAIIFAHPNAQSFTGAVARTYADAVGALGHDVICRDLYGMGFDPVLKSTELPWTDNFALQPDVAAERTLLRDADVYVLVFPFWLNSPPAMMKGYLERVFGFGFAYGGQGHSYNPLLSGRRLINFSSSGAPLAWLQKTGAFDAQCALFDRYFAELCGLALIEHVHFGGVIAGASEAFVQARLAEVRKIVNQHFSEPVMTITDKATAKAPFHLAVWIDHSCARIIPLSPDSDETIIHNRTAVPGNIHHKAGTVGSGHANIDENYLGKVTTAMGGPREILIVGPADAKHALQKYLERHAPALAGRILGVQALGHATEGEIRVFAAEFFLRADPLRPQMSR